MRVRIPGDPDRTYDLVDLGLACCALEVESALRSGLLEFAESPESAPVHCHVLLVAGTVTGALAGAVLRAWQEVPDPKAVVAFGACADSGGPYWDAPTVVPGASALLPVDRYVPGCPPRPQALVDALRALGSVS